MIKIQSPFLHEIQECRVVMRKLRKKIYKHLLIAGPAKKSKDCNQNLLGILKSRNLPNFVIDPLKKRRVIDFNFLKNVTVTNMVSPQKIAELTCNQENEIQKLFYEHKERLRREEKKDEVKLDKKSTKFTSQEGESDQISMISNLENFKINQEEFQIEGQQVESNFDCDGLMLNGPSFLSLHKEPDSDEEWLKF